MSELQPLIVSVKEARRLLGGMANNRFWRLAKIGAFDLVGTETKRWVTVASLNAFVERMPRGDANASIAHVIDRTPSRQAARLKSTSTAK